MNTTQNPTRNRSFGVIDWLLLLATGTMWGSSFLFVRAALVDIDPMTIAWLRIVFGAAVLTLFPASWKPLDRRSDWWLVALLGFVWMALPFTLLGFAQLTIDSALAGMINGAAPLFTALVALLWFRQQPSKTLAVGLIIGFVGIVAVLMPTMTGSISVVGVLLMLGVTVSYGAAFNLSGALQLRNGALAVIWRALGIAAVMTTPTGLIGLGNTTFAPVSFGAVTVLGVVCTGFAFICFTILIGRVGPARASIATYLIPIVAMLLGTLVAGEALHPESLSGIVLVLLGAYLASRGRKAAPSG
ncbi:DMT family transporter [Gulosibacter molinativorax]|uniref:EamA/RhaT family transporter n=1 Tax=Gulosibacter molinativorax TaxID=256821 RepID=A0ABT7CAR9_9MICO|nr:DMT family transporter [Gulosibacter molinativorax]MDJ1371909.1 EamA/RhaT family transporter [Gulosibacter molinativorax]QUY62558.1 Hypothetical protein GMOLON4_1859 [Gulosibacter molinativorax]